jgi:hypothetical protein
MAALREILVEFGVKFDTAPIEAGEKKIGGVLDSLKGLGAALAGAFAVSKIKDFVMGAVELGDALGDSATRLGLSSRALEQWQYAAGFAEISGEELQGMFERVARSAVAGSDAASDQGKALKKLGVDVKDSAGNFKKSDQLFQEIGTSLAELEDGADRTALAMQFFGKAAGPKVLQLFKDGDAGIDKYLNDFEELGGGMGDFVEQAGEVDDQLKRLNLAWTSAKVKVAAFFLPALNLVIAGLIKTSTFITYLTKNTAVVQAALGVFVAFAVAKAALLIAAWWPVIAPFLAWAAGIAVLVLLVEDLIVAWKGGDSVIGRILDKLFGPGSTRKVVAWIKETGEAFSTFFDDLANHPAQFEENWAATSASIKNDITGSLGPALGGITVAWIEEWGVMIDALTGGWDNFLDKSSAVFDGIGLAFKIAWTEIKFFGLGIVAELDDAVTALLKKIPGGLGDGLAGSGTAAADVAKLREKARLAIAAEGDDVGRRLNAPAKGLVSDTPAPVVVNNAPVTNVNLPPGTHAATVRAAGNAAETGAMKGAHRAAKAALGRKGK